MSVIVPTARKSTYESFFNLSTDIQIQGAYQWHQDLAAAAFLILCDFEVILRTQMHKAISSINCYPTLDDWIISTTIKDSLIASLQQDMSNSGNRFYPNSQLYNLQSSFALTKKDKEDFLRIICDFIKKGKIDFSHNDLISSVSFGFWVSVLKLIKKRNSQINQYLKEIFPNSTKGFDENHIDIILDRLYRIKSFRNRIGHHDSIMRIPEPIIGHPDFYPRTISQMINSLTILLSSLLDLVEDIDAEYANTLRNSKNWKNFFILLKNSSFQIYKNNGGNLECYMISYLDDCYNK